MRQQDAAGAANDAAAGVAYASSGAASEEAPSRDEVVAAIGELRACLRDEHSNLVQVRFAAI